MKEVRKMLTIIFLILFLPIIGKLIKFAWKATWGLTKMVLAFVFLPLILVALVICGLVTIALPILLIVGAVLLISSLSRAKA